MHDVVASKKMRDGVEILWNENGAVRHELYTFQELIDQQINMLDILDRPVAYRVDTKLHRLVPKK